ncbi:MAG TPA: hypothetical protein VFM27_22300 [Acidimicrobiales bacterium]|nr:hypothetical protein [Acidimicrobiales bacterium]
MPDPEPKSLPEVATELWAMTKDYARQETIAPLKDVGRYVGFGLGGALLGGLGVIMLMLAGLRALQTETGARFTGSWSWAPYAIVLVGAILLVALAVSRISKK